MLLTLAVLTQLGSLGELESRHSNSKNGGRTRKYHCTSSELCPVSSHDKGKRGKRGPPGPQGAQGFNGANGRNGSVGPQGPTGVNAPFVIPFASGETPIAMLNATLPVLSTASLVGFGNTITGVAIAGTISTSLIGNMAFSMSHDGIITSIAAYFSTATLLGVPSVGISAVRAEIWVATPPLNDLFTPSGVFVEFILPTTPGPLPAGSTFSDIASASFPVSAQQRLLLVYSISPITTSSILTITGYAGAGITIE